MKIDGLEDCIDAFDRLADMVGCKYRKASANFLVSEVEDFIYKKDLEIEALQQEIEELKAQLVDHNKNNSQI